MSIPLGVISRDEVKNLDKGREKVYIYTLKEIM